MPDREKSQPAKKKPGKAGAANEKSGELKGGAAKQKHGKKKKKLGKKIAGAAREKPGKPKPGKPKGRKLEAVKPKKGKGTSKPKSRKRGSLKLPPAETTFLGFLCSCGWKGVFVNDPPKTPCPSCAGNLAPTTKDDWSSREEEVRLCQAAWELKLKTDAAVRRAAAEAMRRAAAEALQVKSAVRRNEREKARSSRKQEKAQRRARLRKEKAAGRDEQLARAGLSRRERKEEVRARVARFVLQLTTRWEARVASELSVRSHDELLAEVDDACNQPVVGRCRPCTTKARKTARVSLKRALQSFLQQESEATQDHEIDIGGDPGIAQADQRYGVLCMAFALAQQTEFYVCARCDSERPRANFYIPRPPQEMRGGVWVVKWV